MKNRDLFLKDPLSWTLLNEGVTSNNSTDENTLRYELTTFVCDGEYHTGLARTLQGFLGNLGKDQKAAWVSGFFGSGKSHMVKVLRHLWSDTKFKDGTTARGLAKLPLEIQDLLKELSTKAKQAGVELKSAGGTLRSGVGSVRLRLLGIVFQSLGFPEKISPARLMLDLREEGHLKAITNALEDKGKQLEEEFSKLYTSKSLHEAYLAVHPQMETLHNVSQAIRSQYPTGVDDITVKEMVQILKKALSTNGKLPFTVIVLDEVQQFINNNADFANDVQEAVEACSKDLEGRVLFVGTGQSALSETASLQKLMGRFATKIHLKDNDVEKVVRTVVLQKNEPGKAQIKKELDHHSGEVTRQLKSTRLETRAEDDDAYVPDYPVLPVRRRFWEKVLHSVDSTGTTAQMRTQLRVTHEACRAVADKPLGTVVPADFLYDQLAVDLIQAGEIQKRFSEIIDEQKKKENGLLRSRVCSLVFLINKLPREVGVDDGVRASVEHLADLMTEDLSEGATKLRQSLPGILTKLVEEGVLMEVDEEFKLQTTEGAAWEMEWKKRRTSHLQTENQISTQRTKYLEDRIVKAYSGMSITHGASRTPRKIFLHISTSAPSSQGGVMVWVRDGYLESESSVQKDIQSRTLEDPIVHLFIPKSRDTKVLIADLMAANETLNFKGHPTTDEGKQARRAMENRLNTANSRLEDMIGDILAQARVSLSGGQAILKDNTRDSLNEAANMVLGRMFPRFQEADNANWHSVLSQAKQGTSNLKAVNHQGDSDKHPVTVEILKKIGPGAKGTDLVAHFGNEPFGWPKDAVHAGLAVLLTSGHLCAKVQGKESVLADMDQKKIDQADYRIQHPVLTAAQMLKVKSLFIKLKTLFKPGSESSVAPAFVQSLVHLAQSAGGEPPAKDAPKPPYLAALAGLQGNDLLNDLFQSQEVITKDIDSWQAIALKLAPRVNSFTTTNGLVDHAFGLEGAEGLLEQLNQVKAHRSILDEPDPIAPIRQKTEEILQKERERLHQQHLAEIDKQKVKMASQDLWAKLPQAKQEQLLTDAGVTLPKTTTPPGEMDLLGVLNLQPFQAKKQQIAALATQFEKAIEKAIQAANPLARKVSLPSTTLKTQADLLAWLAKVQTHLEAALKDGPVIT